MDGQRNARRMRLSIQEIQQENTIHPIRGPIELRPVQARIGSSPGARTPARQRRGVTNRRGAREKSLVCFARVRIKYILSVGCRSDGCRAPMGWTVNEIPSTRTVIGWDTVHSLGAVPGGKATRRRAESRQARSRHCSEQKPRVSVRHPPRRRRLRGHQAPPPASPPRAAPQCARRACLWPGATAFRR